MGRGYDIYKSEGRKIVKGLGYYEPNVVNDLKELVNKSVNKFNDKTGFIFKDKTGEIVEKSYIEFGNDIDSLGTSLIAMGLKDTKIAILSENRYEWGVSYYSIVNGTGVVVPLDKYLPIGEVEKLINRGKVDAIFYSSAYHKDIVELAARNSNIKYFICMDDLKSADKRFVSIPQLITEGEELIKEGKKDFIEAKIDRDKMSILLFTSGTTSISKGVMLSHSNIASNITAISAIIKVYPDDVHLSLLPLHHTFENTAGFNFMVHSGVCIAYSEGIKHIARNLNEFNVSIIIAVPAIFEAMYKKLQEGIKKSGKEGLVNIMLKISNALRCVGIDIRKLLFKSILNKLGPKLRLFISGAAPIDTQIIVGYSNLGLKVLQGYGLTETSPVVCATNDFIDKPHTVGYPAKDIEVTIDSPDESGIGEIMTRSKCVMLGYYEDQKATDEVIDKDGWFRTGDLGIIDREGLIKITGRIKSMIILTNGKKAFPEEYEVLLNNYSEIKDSYVWGFNKEDGDVQICTKIVLDKEMIQKNYNDLYDNKISKRIHEIIREINAQIPKYKIIRYYILTYEDLVKTTTLKIKRQIEDDKINELLKQTGTDMRKVSGKFIDKL